MIFQYSILKNTFQINPYKYYFFPNLDFLKFSICHNNKSNDVQTKPITNVLRFPFKIPKPTRNPNPIFIPFRFKVLLRLLNVKSNSFPKTQKPLHLEHRQPSPKNIPLQTNTKRTSSLAIQQPNSKFPNKIPPKTKKSPTKKTKTSSNFNTKKHQRLFDSQTPQTININNQKKSGYFFHENNDENSI